jgi:beta-phosphoglucomutase-like phosphatase (HAD superfamily)
LVETSELQRQSFNRALAMNGVDWNWNIGTYCDLLKEPGGKKRLSEYTNNQLSAEKVEQIHIDKQSVFEELIRVGVEPRPGCVEALKKCKDNGGKAGFVTTTTPYTIDIIKKSLSTYINFEDFDIITSCETVSKPKPSSEIYEYVLSELNIDATQTIAIEDTKANQNAATNSGITCYLYPGEYSVFSYKDTKDLNFISVGEMLPSVLSD